MMQNPVLDWLMEDTNPSVRYRVQTELLDMDPGSPEVRKTRAGIESSRDVRRIMESMHPEGYWLQTNPRSGEITGSGTKYGAFATTHFMLAYLAELGMASSHPQIARAADRYLGLQQPDGDFINHYSCLVGMNIRTFILLGLRDDPRVQKSINLMLHTDRTDGGYLCGMHEGKYKTRPVKSCFRGAMKMLLAFAELPKYRKHPRVLALLEYFIRHDGIYKTTNRSEYVNKDVQRTSFPIVWRASITEVMYGLARMGLGTRPGFDRAWEFLESKQDDQGRYILDHNPRQAPVSVAKRGQADKWITLYALLAKKYRPQGLDSDTYSFVKGL